MEKNAFKINKIDMYKKEKIKKNLNCIFYSTGKTTKTQCSERKFNIMNVRSRV